MRKTADEITESRKYGHTVFLLTGGTSFIGNRIAMNLLNRGFHVIFLLRGKENLGASERLFRKFRLENFTPPDDNAIKVINARIDAPALGLDRDSYEYLLDHVDEIINCAADTSMKEDKRAQVEKFNIGGTLNLLELAVKGKCRFFHQVSTAYVAGKKEGLCAEAHVPQSFFNNPYEESKLRSEKNVIEITSRSGIRSNIYRPSIVYGDSETGKSIRFNAMYYAVRTVLYLKGIYEKDLDENGGIQSARIGIKRTEDGHLYLPLRIRYVDGCFFDLIPVNYIADGCVKIMEECLEGNGEIFHFSTSVHTPFKRYLELIEQSTGVRGLCAVTDEEFNNSHKNPLEELFYAYMDVYDPYFHDKRIFENKKTVEILSRHGITCPELDLDIFRRCVDYAINVNWGKKLFNGLDQTVNSPPEWENLLPPDLPSKKVA